MADLDRNDLYFPNTKVIRDLLENLNYKITSINPRGIGTAIHYNAICFSPHISDFNQVKQTNKVYCCMNAPTLTEEQTIFVFDILQVCPDYLTFKEALEQYINSTETMNSLSVGTASTG